MSTETDFADRQGIAAAFGEVATIDQGGNAIVQNIASQDRVFGAQAVAVRRDETQVIQKLGRMGKALGEAWYYRFPVRSKGATKYIEGPSIKLANDLSRIYGNCEIDVRVDDKPDSWIFYARFSDYETGYTMTRLFQQRKNQESVKGDADRQRDIAFQIGQSKAIRNVIVNALQSMADFAFEAARDSLIEEVGKNLDRYRTKCVDRLAEMKVDIKRVEMLRGKVVKDWLAQDIAMTIGEIKSVGDGMSSIDETWPLPQREEGEQAKTLEKKLDELADKPKEEKEKPAKEEKKKAEPKEDKAQAKADAKEPATRSDDAGGGGTGEDPHPNPDSGEQSSSDDAEKSDEDPDSKGEAMPTLELAYAAGQEARRKNASRKAVPAIYNDEGELLDSWRDGFDTGEAESGQSG